MERDVARWTVLAITALGVIAIQTAQAVETSNRTAEAEEVTVTGTATSSLTSASLEGSAKQKTQVPGAFTIKSGDEMKIGRASNLKDLLLRIPRVFLQIGKRVRRFQDLDSRVWNNIRR